MCVSVSVCVGVCACVCTSTRVCAKIWHLPQEKLQHLLHFESRENDALQSARHLWRHRHVYGETILCTECISAYPVGHLGAFPSAFTSPLCPWLSYPQCLRSHTPHLTMGKSLAVIPQEKAPGCQARLV